MTLNAATHCASVTRISADQPKSEQARDAAVYLYGSEGCAVFLALDCPAPDAAYQAPGIPMPSFRMR
jgi:hypothetical protein